jgi:hypothetical protein
MQSKTRQFLTIVSLIGLGLMLSLHGALADEPSFKELSAEWQQWVLSIPTPVNPLLDITGEHCMVGQRGAVWFLTGTSFGGTVTRACDVPEGKPLFFPVVNSVNINSPNVCGQDATNLSVQDLRAASAGCIDEATNLSVKVDGTTLQQLQRVKSIVFEVALPEANVFDAPCIDAGLGNVPAGIYSPAVDDGFYVRLEPLEVGLHTLRIQGTSPCFNSNLDVTYHLTVAPVELH